MFFLWGFVKDAVYVPPLLKNLNDLRNRITAAVHSVTHGIRHQVWDELNYRLDVICAAGGEILNVCKLPCMYTNVTYRIKIQLIVQEIQQTEIVHFESACILYCMGLCLQLYKLGYV